MYVDGGSDETKILPKGASSSIPTKLFFQIKVNRIVHRAEAAITGPFYTGTHFTLKQNAFIRACQYYFTMNVVVSFIINGFVDFIIAIWADPLF